MSRANQRPARHASSRRGESPAGLLLTVTFASRRRSGEHDDIVPLMHGAALAAPAPEPKRLQVFAGAGHDDLLTRAGTRWAETITAWVRDLDQPGDDAARRPPSSRRRD